MAISFTNTSGTGFNFASYVSQDWWNAAYLATPSNAADGALLLQLIGAGYDSSFSAVGIMLVAVAALVDFWRGPGLLLMASHTPSLLALAAGRHGRGHWGRDERRRRHGAGELMTQNRRRSSGKG